MIYRIFKRTADIISSVMLLLAISPVMVVLAVLVRVKLGGPVFFKQVRTGMNMKPFHMIKFRTMTSACDENGVCGLEIHLLTNFRNCSTL